jgi:polar amino acid transport system substrate-binding protein
MTRSRVLGVAAVLVAGLTFTAGCASSATSSQPGTAAQSSPAQGGAAPSSAAQGTSGADKSLSALLPADIRQAGVVQTGSSFSFQPLYYYSESNQPSGIVIDILNEANKRLGISAKWQEMQYPNLLIGLQSDKIQVAGSQFTRTADNANQAIFFGIWQNGISLLVRKGTNISTETDVCGLTIGVPSTVQGDIDWAKKVNGQCTGAGKPGVNIKEYDQTTDQLIALRSKQIDGMVNSTLSETYAAKTDTSLVIALPNKIANNVSGFAVAKNDPQLANAYKAAITQMMADGTYKKIFDKYGLGYAAFSKVVINPAV